MPPNPERSLQLYQRPMRQRLKLFIEEHIDQTNGPIQVYEHLRFLDYLRFMITWLGKLVESNKQIEKYQYSDIKLLQGKGCYPYSYINSFDQFKESKLPPMNNWIKSLSAEYNVPSTTQSE